MIEILDPDEELPPYEVVGAKYDRDTPSFLSIICRRHRIEIKFDEQLLRDENKDETIVSKYYKRLLSAICNDNPSEIEDLNPEDYDLWFLMEDLAVQILCPVMRNLPPITADSHPAQTLHDYANPPILHYKLQWEEGKAVPVAWEGCGSEVEPVLRSVTVSPSVCLDFKKVSPHDILLPLDIERGDAKLPKTVQLRDGEKMFIKYIFDAVAEGREINYLQRIHEIGLHRDHRLPQLYGCVQYEGSKDVLGILIRIIDVKLRLDKALVTADRELRQSWYDDVAATVATLHNAGLVWGDVKAHNVLIDNNDKPWVIDFGGGYTEGWVEKQHMETVEGDLQGLANIRHYLKLSSSED
jgi:hypothetical protein